MQALLSLSNDLAAAVERAARSIVAVHARPRLPSTGVHWRPGIVVTAEHTVRTDDDIRVAWADGRAAPATLVARDPGSDLAVVRIADAEWPVAEVGDSALAVGHLVLAVGYGPRASLGVISAVDDASRGWPGGEADRLLRVDLVLYPGFSGGPLVDAAGNVAGIVTSGLSRQLEVAVPAATVTRVVDELLSRGRISRGYIGLGCQPVLLPDALRRLAPTSSAHALLVVSLDADGPAARAGVMLGDVLLALEGTPVHDLGDVQAVVAGRRAGSAVTASILRAGTPVELTITLGERPARRR
ncbi:MAG TPA: S1C family serine protease [Candidatus Tectomicrobia bacterium]|nr:S1C family serine protease [Candidatus Tectomicrobia bacterium]